MSEEVGVRIVRIIFRPNSCLKYQLFERFRRKREEGGRERKVYSGFHFSRP